MVAQVTSIHNIGSSLTEKGLRMANGDTDSDGFEPRDYLKDLKALGFDIVCNYQIVRKKDYKRLMKKAEQKVQQVLERAVQEGLFDLETGQGNVRPHFKIHRRD